MGLVNNFWVLKFYISILIVRFSSIYVVKFIYKICLILFKFDWTEMEFKEFEPQFKSAKIRKNPV